ncbi:MAG: APC family permease [Terriglobales bacterium]
MAFAKSPATAPPPSPGAEPGLERGLNLRGALALNLIDMVGVGPFLTIPLIVQAMGGPQAMLGWILGAGLALCDGWIWAELGATFPGAGGTYQYLSQIFGPRRWGRLFSFLFVWQTLFSAPLLMASGCIGLALYATYLWPALDHPLFSLGAHISISHATLLAMATSLLALALAWQQTRWINRVSQWLWAGVAGTILWVIFAGVTHFDAHRAFTFPPHAFRFSSGFLAGLGSALVIAIYDFWGYETANFMAAEVRQPERNLPRAILGSIAVVSVVYLVMNISVLGVVPWQELMGSSARPVQSFVVSVFMERIYGSGAARVVTGLIVWTAFASVFSLLLGYSRVLYAAAVDGNFLAGFARLHPRKHFPGVALLTLGLVTTAFCVFRLSDVIAALVAISLLLKYLLQAVGLLVLRRRRPQAPRPYRMPGYPLPALIAIAGFVFLLLAPAGALRELSYAGAILLAGLLVFLARARRQRAWPFAGPG